MTAIEAGKADVHHLVHQDPVIGELGAASVQADWEQDGSATIAQRFSVAEALTVVGHHQEQGSLRRKPAVVALDRVGRSSNQSTTACSPASNSPGARAMSSVR